jgi:hypothetical protein
MILLLSSGNGSCSRWNRRSQIPTSGIWIGGYLDSTGIISVSHMCSSRKEDEEGQMCKCYGL